MLAVEFMGPYGSGGVRVDMVYADKNPQAQAVWQQGGYARAKELGTAFLAEETVEYIETEGRYDLMVLLKIYQKSASSHQIRFKTV